MTMTVFDKFVSLHQGEEQVRAESLRRLAVDAECRQHAKVVEQGQDLLFTLIHAEPHSDDDDLAIRMLGIRAFNSCAACLKLMLSGYYQAATAQMRDILETAFLLDYFLTDRSLIAEWRSSDKKIRVTKFGPGAIRKALDDRDGFTERKREAAYNLLCELGTHPTNKGFQMLLIDGVNVHCGPFLENTALKAVLAELAKTHIQAVLIFQRFIEWRTVEVAEAKIDFMEAQGLWFHEICGQPLNTELLLQLRTDLAQIKAAAATKPTATGA